MKQENQPLHLTAIAFNDLERAFRLQEALVKLQAQSVHDFVDAVVVTHDPDGKVKMHSAIKATMGWAIAGSVAGMIVGLIFMLPWAGSIVGAGVGAAVGGRRDLGFDERFKEGLIAALKPGCSALVLLGPANLDKLGEKIGPLLEGATFLQSTVDPKREAEIRNMMEKYSASDSTGLSTE